LIPDNAERLLYIDGDTIIVDSLEELETFSFEENKSCAMIRERVFKGYNTIIGIKESDNYYNAGVTLFNMTNWRSQKCSERLLTGVREGRANYHLADQDLLCSVINENIQTLPVRFNVHSLWLDIGIENLYWYFDVGESNLYSIAEINNALENPAILHCSVGNSAAPWQKGNKNPFKKEWEMYKSISPWKDLENVKVKRKLSKKIRWIMFSIFPRSLYLKIFKYHNVKRLKKLYGN
jgi:lipopolysaccharide biosynthesis glycosyltransferase